MSKARLIFLMGLLVIAGMLIGDALSEISRRNKVGRQITSGDKYTFRSAFHSNIWDEFDRYQNNYANLPGEEVAVGNCKGKWVDITDSESIQGEWFVGWDSGGQVVMQPYHFMNDQWHPEYFKNVTLRSNISYGEADRIISKIMDEWQDDKRLSKSFQQAGLQALIEVSQALRFEIKYKIGDKVKIGENLDRDSVAYLQRGLKGKIKDIVFSRTFPYFVPLRGFPDRQCWFMANQLEKQNE